MILVRDDRERKVESQAGICKLQNAVLFSPVPIRMQIWETNIFLPPTTIFLPFLLTWQRRSVMTKWTLPSEVFNMSEAERSMMPSSVIDNTDHLSSWSLLVMELHLQKFYPVKHCETDASQRLRESNILIILNVASSPATDLIFADISPEGPVPAGSFILSKDWRYLIALRTKRAAFPNFVRRDPPISWFSIISNAYPSNNFQKRSTAKFVKVV